MGLENRVMSLLKDAMRKKDDAALRTLRGIKAALLEYKTSGKAQDVISEEEEIKILQKMAKQRKDSLQIFQEQNRPDLARKEEEELNILQQFLPQPLSEVELTDKVKSLISQLGATSAADMGKVMGLASKELAGQADGAQIAKKVKELLK